VRGATLEVAAYHVGIREFDLPTAAALAFEQLAVTFLAALAYTWLISRAAAAERPARDDELPPLSAASRPLVALAALVAAGLLLPLAAVVARALATPAGVSLAAFARLATVAHPATALRNSVLYALGTVALALPVGALAAVCVARSRRPAGAAADALWMLPLGTSAVTLGLGYLLLPVGAWRTSALLIVLAHALIAFPFVVRALVGPLRARDATLAEAAATLGAGTRRRLLRVHLPLLSPALLVGAVLAASVSLGEFGATLILQRPETTTLPVEAYRLLSTVRPDPWLLPEAMAMATILLALDVAAFLALERLRPGRSGGF
jgi:thiamine transport system permease protein